MFHCLGQTALDSENIFFLAIRNHKSDSVKMRLLSKYDENLMESSFPSHCWEM